MTLNDSDVAAVRERYLERIRKHGLTLESLNSGSAEKQRLRHAIHTEALRGPAPAILDIGCGLAHFYEYVRDQFPQCSYVGYDIVGDYIEDNRRRHPEASFETRNVFVDGIQGEFDTVVMSQVLNNRYQHSDNLAVMREVLTMALSHARQSVSIDMLSSYVDFQSPDHFHYVPEDTFSFAKTLCRFVSLRHDYAPYEFCIQLFK